MARKETQPTTELGRQLEKERENRNLTIDRWCEELDISRPTYLGWRTKATDIEFQNIRRIAVVMGVSIDTVFGWLEVDVPIIHVTPWFPRPIETLARLGRLAAAA